MDVLELARYTGVAAQQPANEPAPLVLLPVLTIPELRARNAAMNWLVKRFIPAESVGLFFGASGTFKSFIALDLALHVAHGMKWMGQKTKKGSVLFIAAEGGAGVWRRVDAWRRVNGIRDDSVEFFVLPQAVDLVDNTMRLIETLRQMKINPALIVVDTVSQTFSGEENSATEMSAYLRALGLLRQAWLCTVLAVHHTGHVATERPRGSSVIRANVDFMFGVFRDEAEMLATFECVKQKDGDKPSATTFSLRSFELGTDEDGEAVTSLVAVRVAEPGQIVEMMEHEAARGRGGRNHMFLDMAVNGIEEKKLRTLFCEAIDGDATKKRQAYFRAKKWAVDAGVLEVAMGFVIRL